MHKRIIGNPTTTPMAKPDMSNKVDKIVGKGLSANDFTDDYKNAINNNEYAISSLQFSFSSTMSGIRSDINEIEMRVDTIESDMYQTPITTIPTTLTPNQQYNFGEVTELALAFPTVANDGDVIYATFITGETATALTIDTTNTCDIEFVPETHTGYEVFGKFNGSIWIVNYSEYTVSEG